MPTIVIRDRMDRSDKSVTVTLAATKTGEQKLTYHRGMQYVVSDEVLEVLEHSHESPYLMVLDRHSKEPTTDELPPLTEETKGKLGELVGAFGRAKEKAST